MVIAVIPLPQRWARCGCDWEPCCWMLKSPAMPGPCWPVRVSGSLLARHRDFSQSPKTEHASIFQAMGKSLIEKLYYSCPSISISMINIVFHDHPFQLLCISSSIHLGSMIGPCLDTRGMATSLLQLGSAPAVFSPTIHQDTKRFVSAPCTRLPWKALDIAYNDWSFSWF